MYKNSEGYLDPTAGTALEHIEYEEYLKKRSIKTHGYEIAKKITTHYLSCENNGSTERYDFQVEN